MLRLFARLLLIEVEVPVEELDGGIARKLAEFGRTRGHDWLKYGCDKAIHSSRSECLQRKSNSAEKQGTGDEAIENCLRERTNVFAKTQRSFSVAIKLCRLAFSHSPCHVAVTNASFYAAHLIERGNSLTPTNNTEL